MRLFTAFLHFALAVPMVMHGMSCPAVPLGPMKAEYSPGEPMLVYAYTPGIARDAAQFRWRLEDGHGLGIRLSAAVIDRESPILLLKMPEMKSAGGYTLRVKRGAVCQKRTVPTCQYPLADRMKIRIAAASPKPSDAESAAWQIESVRLIENAMVNFSTVRFRRAQARRSGTIPLIAEFEDAHPDASHPRVVTLAAYSNETTAVFGQSSCDPEPALAFGRSYTLRLSTILNSRLTLLAGWRFAVPFPPGMTDEEMKLIQEYRAIPNNVNPGTAAWSRMQAILANRPLWDKYRTATRDGVEFNAEQLAIKPLG